MVVDAFDPSVLVSDCATRVFDFSTMKEEELYDIRIPLDLLVGMYITPACIASTVPCWLYLLRQQQTCPCHELSQALRV